jgi:hypothetical protein
MIAPMEFFKSAEQKEIELEMIEDLKRLDFWITGDYRGYYDITQDTTLELMVPFSDAYATKFRAGTFMQALIEVTEGTNAVAFFFPKLEIAADPVRNDEGSLAGVTLMFRAHEDSTSTVLTGTNLEKHRSRMHILVRA